MPVSLGVLFRVILAFSFLPNLSLAESNSWTNSAGGKWEEPYWSLGTLPASTHSIFLTNQGSRELMIDAATATTYPDSLKINDLTIDGENRLLLNGSGSSVPFVIGIGLSLSNGAAFQTVESGLVIDNGLLKIINAQMSQDGGRVQLSDQGAFLDRKGTYNLTGGSFQSTVVGIGNVDGGLFNQYGGSAALSSLQIGYWFEGSAYHLYAGELQVSELLRIGGQYGGSLFIQDGGTNRALEVRIFPYYGGAAYYLNGGLLSDSNVL